MNTFDLYSRDPLLLINPKLDVKIKNHYYESFKKLKLKKPFIGIASSGSSGTGVKIVLLSKEALCASAEAVNKHLEVTSQDHWLNLLPTFHVGGLGIHIRSKLMGSVVFDGSEEKWSISNFSNWIQTNQFSLLSLVPTQVFDIVKAQIKCPPSIKKVVVGGGILDKDLYLQARNLNWPLLPSFGMTECSSQIATADLSSLDQNKYPDFLKILSHCSLQTDNTGKLKIKSKALCSGIIKNTQDDNWEISNPLDADGWYSSNDLVQLKSQYLKFLKRNDDQIKIKGELASVLDLRNRFSPILRNFKLTENDLNLFATKSDRDENKLILFCVKSISPESIHQILEQWNQHSISYLKIHEFKYIDELPKSELGKIPFFIY